MWKSEKKRPPQDPGTKRRNLGHPPRDCDLRLKGKLSRTTDQEFIRTQSPISGAPGGLRSRLIRKSKRRGAAFGPPLFLFAGKGDVDSRE
jgi:hypothetical protein